MTQRSGRLLLLAAFIVAACCAALVSVRLFLRQGRAPSSVPSVVVETPTPTPAPATPAAPTSTIIDLPGDPVFVRRGATVAPHSIRVNLPIALTANAPKFDGAAFFVSTAMVSTDGGFMGKFLESGENADQAAIARADPGAQGNVEGDVPLAAGLDGAGGANAPPYAESL